MKTTLALFLALFIGSVAHGHTLKPLRKATDVKMEQVRLAAAQLADEMNELYGDNGGGTVFAAYEVRKVSPRRKPGETTEKMFARVVKAALHRDHPITGDDGGYSFDYMSAVESLPFPSVEDLETDKKMKLLELLREVAPRKQFLVIYGEGAGNNTIAYILAVVDIANSEFFYVVDSNFGSDN